VPRKESPEICSIRQILAAKKCHFFFQKCKKKKDFLFLKEKYTAMRIAIFSAFLIIPLIINVFFIILMLTTGLLDY